MGARRKSNVPDGSNRNRYEDSWLLSGLRTATHWSCAPCDKNSLYNSLQLETIGFKTRAKNYCQHDWLTCSLPTATAQRARSEEVPSQTVRIAVLVCRSGRVPCTMYVCNTPRLGPPLQAQRRSCCHGKSPLGPGPLGRHRPCSRVEDTAETKRDSRSG